MKYKIMIIKNLFHTIYLLFSMSYQVGYFGLEQTRKAARLCHGYIVLT
ncbi:hypothetical protein IPH25_04770 [bacterium]|nr:MAG: hypothetical protein IPG37_01765 [bacterium]QQR61753.1 MAG: hypothetical protein IPH25_04770 [bacterium]QQR62674.1 MAG: hypothetical protein IPH67_04640 [bacterium]